MRQPRLSLQERYVRPRQIRVVLNKQTAIRIPFDAVLILGLVRSCLFRCSCVFVHAVRAMHWICGRGQGERTTPQVLGGAPRLHCSACHPGLNNYLVFVFPSACAFCCVDMTQKCRFNCSKIATTSPSGRRTPSWRSRRCCRSVTSNFVSNKFRALLHLQDTLPLCFMLLNDRLRKGIGSISYHVLSAWH